MPNHTVTFSSICEDVRYGYTASATDTDTGVHFLRVTDIARERLDWSSVPFCEITDRDLDRQRLLRDDIVIARMGTIGASAIVAEDVNAVAASYLIRHRIDATKADARFVAYVLRSPLFRDFIAGHGASGSVQPNINARTIGAFEVPLPSLSEQRAITGVLGTLDDKIEQNRQTAEALEQLARAIFRAWFVDFEPVKAKAAGADSFPSMPQHVFDSLPTRFVDSAIGPVPEGWHSRSLGDVIDIHDSQRVPLSRREREQRSGFFRYYGATGIIDYVNDFLFDGMFVLVGEDGTVVNDQDGPVVQYVWGRFWVNNHAHILTGSNGISTEHLRVLLDHINIRPFVTGAVQPKLNQRNLKSVPILAPPPEATAAFNDIIAPLFAWLREAHDQSHLLESMRDLLLPQLLSGQVRVEVGDA